MVVMKIYIFPYEVLNPQPLGLCVTPLTIKIIHVMYITGLRNTVPYLQSYEGLGVKVIVDIKA